MHTLLVATPPTASVKLWSTKIIEPHRTRLLLLSWSHFYHIFEVYGRGHYPRCLLLLRCCYSSRTSA
jgi:hypothetical protein